MTFREKLALEHPTEINKCAMGGCTGCPSSYGYTPPDDRPCYPKQPNDELCSECWDREIPGTEPTSQTVIEHDGCRECNHFDKEEFEYPCSDCKGTAQPSSQEYNTRNDLFEPKEVDMVNAPPHYTKGMECIDEMITVFGEKTVAHFCLCNVWKYRKRAIHKNGQEDMDKADWYMNKYTELIKSEYDPTVRLP